MKSKAPGEGLAEAIGAAGETFNTIRQQRREKEVREAVIEESRENRAGTFDVESGGFIEPEIGTPAFNPEDPEPITSRVATGTEAGTPATEAAPEPVLPLPEMGRAGAAGTPTGGPRSRAAQGTVDRFMADFGDTESMLARREQELQTERQLDAIGDLDPRTQRLVRAGVLTPAQALTDGLNRTVHARLQAEDPSIGEFIPGFDYVAEHGDERDHQQAVEIQNIEDTAAMDRRVSQDEASFAREELEQEGLDRRLSITEAGKDRRATKGTLLKERRKTLIKQIGAPNTPAETIALDLKAQGMPNEDIIVTALSSAAEQGLTHGELSILAGNIEAYLNGSAGLLDGRVNPKQSPLITAGRGPADFQGKELDEVRDRR